MIKPKVLAVSAVAGFCLSFIIGLIYKVGFPHAFLRGLIFAVIFSVVAVAFSFVYEKFLSTSSSFSENDSSASGGATQTGTAVNITIDDEPLPDDEFAPKFTVENNRPSLGADSLSENTANAKSAEASVQKTEAQPDIALNSNSQSEAAFKPASLGDITKKSDSVDELPELGDFSASSSESMPSIDTTDFSSSPSTLDSSGGMKSDQDAKLMAQTIRTVLLREDS